VNNNLPQEYSVFQKMMNHFLGQQYTVHSPMGQQFPFNQMISPLPSNSFMPSCQNQAANFKPGQNAFKWALPHSSDSEVCQKDESTSKRKREQLICNNDSCIENDKKKQRECDQNYKCKAKKKSY
ncbi:RBM11 regulator, partial [Nothocercus nigrocapillus]|nr:RBM11 regulator [Nothocercus nigrocapillus]